MLSRFPNCAPPHRTPPHSPLCLCLIPLPVPYTSVPRDLSSLLCLKHTFHLALIKEASRTPGPSSPAWPEAAGIFPPLFPRGHNGPCLLFSHFSSSRSSELSPGPTPRSLPYSEAPFVSPEKQLSPSPPNSVPFLAVGMHPGQPPVSSTQALLPPARAQGFVLCLHACPYPRHHLKPGPGRLQPKNPTQ